MSDLGDEIDSFLSESVSIRPTSTRFAAMSDRGPITPLIIAGLSAPDLQLLRYMYKHQPSGIKVCDHRLDDDGQAVVAVQLHNGKPGEDLTDSTLRFEIVYPLAALRANDPLWAAANDEQGDVRVVHMSEVRAAATGDVLDLNDEPDLLDLAESLDPFVVLEAARRYL